MTDNPRNFEDTRWSLILEARSDNPSSDSALTELCNAYWFPVYTFIRRKGHDGDNAKDLTQEFFALFLERHFLDRVDKSSGRFRSFLMTCISNFLHDEWRRKKSVKRGGDMQELSLDFENADSLYAEYSNQHASPESWFDAQWARTVMARAFERLKTKHYKAGNEARFDALSVVLTESSPDDGYRELGERIDMNENAARTAAHRLRKEYMIALREEVASTIAVNQDVSDELQVLLDAIRTG